MPKARINKFVAAVIVIVIGVIMATYPVPMQGPLASFGSGSVSNIVAVGPEVTLKQMDKDQPQSSEIEFTCDAVPMRQTYGVPFAVLTGVSGCAGDAISGFHPLSLVINWIIAAITIFVVFQIWIRMRSKKS